ncbi:MAG: helix-turn-helix transcriptional regulator, partial [Acetobacteraceae bacterium]|nr:helix-turn-helix transcriptional regulator [Acetobacteraceae bacterium]
VIDCASAMIRTLQKPGCGQAGRSVPALRLAAHAACMTSPKSHRICEIVKGFRMKDVISAAQSRGARGLLGWSREKLAEASGVPSRTVADFELGNTKARPRTVQAIRAALEAAGVEFIEENGGGPGVRLRKGGGASAA